MLRWSPTVKTHKILVPHSFKVEYSLAPCMWYMNLWHLVISWVEVILHDLLYSRAQQFSYQQQNINNRNNYWASLIPHAEIKWSSVITRTAKADMLELLSDKILFANWMNHILNTSMAYWQVGLPLRFQMVASKTYTHMQWCKTIQFFLYVSDAKWCSLHTAVDIEDIRV